MIVANGGQVVIADVQVEAGQKLADELQGKFVKCDVSTYCLGQAASMGAVLLACGTKGKRYVLPNARVMIHQPWGGTQGTASDISIQAKEILKMKEHLNRILSKHTGKPLEQIEKDSDRDFFMSAQEAKDYGILANALANQTIVMVGN